MRACVTRREIKVLSRHVFVLLLLLLGIPVLFYAVTLPFGYSLQVTHVTRARVT